MVSCGSDRRPGALNGLRTSFIVPSKHLAQSVCNGIGQDRNLIKEVLLVVRVQCSLVLCDCVYGCSCRESSVAVYERCVSERVRESEYSEPQCTGIE